MTFGFSPAQVFSEETLDKVGNGETYTDVASSLIWFSTRGLWFS